MCRVSGLGASQRGSLVEGSSRRRVFESTLLKAHTAAACLLLCVVVLTKNFTTTEGANALKTTETANLVSREPPGASQ